MMKKFFQSIQSILFRMFGDRYEKLNSVEKLQAAVLIHAHLFALIYILVQALVKGLEANYTQALIFLIGGALFTAGFGLYRLVHHQYIALVIVVLGLGVSLKADLSSFHPTRLLIPGLYISSSFIIGGSFIGTVGFFGAIGLYLHGTSLLKETPEHAVGGIMILLALYAIMSFFYRNLYKAYNVVDQERKVTKGLLEEISNILNHIKQGIFVFDRNFVTTRKSRFLDSIVNSSGEEQVKNLLDNSSLNGDQIAQAYTVLGSVFNEDLISFEANSHLLPRSIVYLNHYSLEIDWEPLTDDAGLITHILVVVRDMTELNKVKEEEKEKDRELKAFSLFLGKKKEGVRRFIADAQETYKAALGEVKHHNYSKKALAHNLHTIKGNARTLGLLEIADAVHNNETLLQSDAESVDLANSLEQTYGNILYYRNVEKKIYVATNKDSLPEKIASELFRCNEKKIDAAKTIALLNQIARFDSLESILADQVESLSQVAEQLGKDAPVVEFHTGAIVVDRDIAKRIETIFVHVFNNSLDHGIESPEERKQANKNPIPKIKISAYLDNHLTITISDDGRGLDLDGLRKKSGLSSAATEQEVADTIFEAGTSTKTKVTLISGRGIGMSAVKSAVEEAGGHISIDLDPATAGKSMRTFSLRVQFPAKLAEIKAST